MSVRHPWSDARFVGLYCICRYDFKFHTADWDVDHPALVLSNTKSLFKVGLAFPSCVLVLLRACLPWRACSGLSPCTPAVASAALLLASVSLADLTTQSACAWLLFARTQVDLAVTLKPASAIPAQLPSVAADLLTAWRQCVPLLCRRLALRFCLPRPACCSANLR